jgi:hypothetical protein
MDRVHLYIDDSGSRRIDRYKTERRCDGMDCFALGGILIAEGAISTLLKAHATLTAKWKISSPLHSTKIRGRRDAFAWLGLDQSREENFLNELEKMILAFPSKGWLVSSIGRDMRLDILKSFWSHGCCARPHSQS